MTHVLGVDLGGTTVAAAIADEDGRPEMVALGDRSIIVPAVVHQRDGGSLVTGEVAARRAATDPSRAAWGVRRRLGDPAPVLIGEQTRPATDLLAAILRDVLGRVAAVRGETPRRVVLTHPAGWGPFRRGLFEDVAGAAGLADAAMTTDPQAAGAQQRSLHGLDDGAAFAVYDLGGSSFEASVLVRRADALEAVGSPVDIERLGGVDFDEAVIALVDEASGGLLADLDPDDDASAAVLSRLRQDCLVAKEALSSEDEVHVPVLLPGRHAEVAVSRAAFEERIRPTVTRSVDALARAVDAAPVRPGAVLLVGGSARVPLVGRAVAERLGLRVIVDDHPEYVMALGAARAAARLAGSDLGRSSRAGGATAAAEPPGAASGSPSKAKARSRARSKPRSETTAESAASESEASPPTTVTPRPVVDGRLAGNPDDAQTTVNRPGSPADDTKTTVTRPDPSSSSSSSKSAANASPASGPAPRDDDEAKTTVNRPGSSDEARTAVVRPTPGSGSKPRAGGPPTRSPAEPGPTPPRQGPARPGMPSGSFPAAGRPGGPGQGPPGQSPGQTKGVPMPGAPGPGRRPGPPGGPPPPGPGGPPLRRPMTGPFPGAPGQAQGPVPPAPSAPSDARSTRTVVLVVAAVIVLLVLVGGALLVTGVL
ncbi:Hsp70 family protein [Actinomycetospora sp.]|uniref:Hsp70 family protein n=1 Tax=Actinomycetospora sp. TaxID=1872135 RepID=UPI002F4292B8